MKTLVFASPRGNQGKTYAVRLAATYASEANPNLKVGVLDYDLTHSKTLVNLAKAQTVVNRRFSLPYKLFSSIDEVAKHQLDVLFVDTNGGSVAVKDIQADSAHYVIIEPVKPPYPFFNSVLTTNTGISSKNLSLLFVNASDSPTFDEDVKLARSYLGDLVAGYIPYGKSIQTLHETLTNPYDVGLDAAHTAAFAQVDLFLRKLGILNTEGLNK